MGINERRVTREGGINLAEATFPPKGTCWRGGAFDNQFRSFFTKGKMYRIPVFLATSAKETIAESFLFKVPKTQARVKWRVQVHPKGEKNAKYRTHHMTFVSKTLIPGEGEYLFAPFSIFTVFKAKWSKDKSEPHLIVLKAAVDNIYEKELPLAPWY